MDFTPFNTAVAKLDASAANLQTYTGNLAQADFSGNVATMDTIIANLQNGFHNMLYDLIVDSDAKLALWANDTTGKYEKVLIKKGTWTFNGDIALNAPSIEHGSPNFGTKVVVGEPGSVIQGEMLSLRYWSEAMDPSELCYLGCWMQGVTIKSSSTSSIPVGFSGCVNLYNCNATTTGPTGGYPFDSCTNVVNCNARAKYTGTPTTGGDFSNCVNLSGCLSRGLFQGFQGCINLSSCESKYASVGFRSCEQVSSSKAIHSVGAGTFKGFQGCKQVSSCQVYFSTLSACTAIGFEDCKRLSSCFFSLVVSGSISVMAYGFYTCQFCVGCTVEMSGTGTGNRYGFNACTGVGTCHSVVAGGTPVGFYGCNRCGNSLASATTKYSGSFADLNANACADTAAGGYNG